MGGDERLHATRGRLQGLGGIRTQKVTLELRHDLGGSGEDVGLDEAGVFHIRELLEESLRLESCIQSLHDGGINTCGAKKGEREQNNTKGKGEMGADSLSRLDMTEGIFRPSL